MGEGLVKTISEALEEIARHHKFNPDYGGLRGKYSGWVSEDVLLWQYQFEMPDGSSKFIYFKFVTKQGFYIVSGKRESLDKPVEDTLTRSKAEAISAFREKIENIPLERRLYIEAASRMEKPKID